MRQDIIFQRAEALAIFVASLFVYWHLSFNLVAFVALLFVFDVSMVGYLLNNKMGALVYNLGHNMMLPSLLVTASFAADTRQLAGFSLVWFAHIGMDRALGYGLKSTSGFTETHLGRIGKK
jgi:hypothetical protein